MADRRPSGTTACLGMLLAMNFDLGFRGARLIAVSRPLASTINHVVADAPG